MKAEDCVDALTDGLALRADHLPAERAHRIHVEIDLPESVRVAEGDDIPRRRRSGRVGLSSGRAAHQQCPNHGHDHPTARLVRFTLALSITPIMTSRRLQVIARSHGDRAANTTSNRRNPLSWHGETGRAAQGVR